MKLIAVGGCMGAPRYFADMFKEHFLINMIDSDKALEEAISNITNQSVVMLGGGEDISPSIYRARPSNLTYAPDNPSRRDEIEMRAFAQAVKVGARIFGICRGAQMVCALSGGSLYQHVDNHAGRDHEITTVKGEKFITSSAHHQMMNPNGSKFDTIAWATEQRSPRYVVDDSTILNDIGPEPEIVFFPETQALGVQGHPEFMPINSPFVQYNRQLVKEYLFK